MAKYAAVLDLDGTLAYTIDDIHTAIVRMLDRLGYETRTKEEVLSFINNGARFLIMRSLPKDAQDSDMIVDTALALYEEEYSKCYAEKTYAYDGMNEVFIWARISKASSASHPASLITRVSTPPPSASPKSYHTFFLGFT